MKEKRHFLRAKRAAGWCKAASGFMCIARSGVAYLKALNRIGRLASLMAGALFEAGERFFPLN